MGSGCLKMLSLRRGYKQLCRHLRTCVPSGHRLTPRPPLCPRLQRGDAEVSQKLWRVVRACVELGDKNPIEQIHDQVGGGGWAVVGGGGRW